MCLILFAYRTHPDYRLILAANRDEFFARPTEALAFWPDQPEILAGRDLQAGGTWFGLSGDGRFAAVTNYRDPRNISAEALSRGRIPIDYLQSRLNPQRFCAAKRGEWSRYNGFNLLAGDRQNLVWASNRSRQEQDLSPGLYGLSNHLLDSRWPKVKRGKERLRHVLAASGPVEPDDLFNILEDRWQPPDSELPDTGVGLAWERLLAPLFISGEDYGTRSSLALTITEDGQALCSERTFVHEQGIVREIGRKTFELDIYQKK